MEGRAKNKVVFPGVTKALASVGLCGREKRVPTHHQAQGGQRSREGVAVPWSSAVREDSTSPKEERGCPGWEAKVEGRPEVGQGRTED